MPFSERREGFIKIQWYESVVHNNYLGFQWIIVDRNDEGAVGMCWSWEQVVQWAASKDQGSERR